VDRALEGKGIVVTGAGSGIGQAIAVAAAGAGARVCVAGRTLAALEETRTLIAQAQGPEVLAVQTDIGDAASVASLFRLAAEEIGRVDGIVANAGMMAPSPPVHAFDIAGFRQAIDVNLIGTVQTVAEGARVLVGQGGGGIILATGSSLVLRGGPGMAGYVTSKAAIHAFVKAAALDLAPHGVRVNLLVPGTTRTPPLERMEGFLERAAAMTPLGEVALPEEIGALAVFLMSGAVPHMTGAELVVDSGRSLGS